MWPTRVRRPLLRWVRSNRGEELNANEAAIFENLVIAVNDQAFYAAEAERLLLDKADDIAQTEIAAFAGFLSGNPGAHEVWRARELRLARYRKQLVPGGNLYSGYPEAVRAALATLEQGGS